MVISASWQKLCNFGPLVAIFLVCLDDLVIFLFRPLVLLDVWIQMVVPPLSALLSYPARQSLGYLTPVLRSKHMDFFREFVVLLLAPRALDHRWVEHLLPPVQALHVSSLIQRRGNSLPVLGSEALDQLSQLLVFF